MRGQTGEGGDDCNSCNKTGYANLKGAIHLISKLSLRNSKLPQAAVRRRAASFANL
jgi:hypothetical protein